MPQRPRLTLTTAFCKRGTFLQIGFDNLDLTLIRQNVVDRNNVEGKHCCQQADHSRDKVQFSGENFHSYENARTEGKGCLRMLKARFALETVEPNPPPNSDQFIGIRANRNILYLATAFCRSWVQSCVSV